MTEWINRYEYGPARRVTLSPGVERLVRAAAEPPRCRTCRYWLPFGPRNLTGECESWDVAASPFVWHVFVDQYRGTEETP